MAQALASKANSGIFTTSFYLIGIHCHVIKHTELTLKVLTTVSADVVFLSPLPALFTSKGQRGVFGSLLLDRRVERQASPPKTSTALEGCWQTGGNFVSVICLRSRKLRAEFAPSFALLPSPRPPSVLPPSLIHLFLFLSHCFFFLFFQKSFKESRLLNP